MAFRPASWGSGAFPIKYSTHRNQPSFAVNTADNAAAISAARIAAVLGSRLSDTMFRGRTRQPLVDSKILNVSPYQVGRPVARSKRPEPEGILAMR